MSQLLQGLQQQLSTPVDSVPAQLTENEFVIPADVVLILGNGDPEAGAAKLQAFIDQTRASMNK